MSTKKFRFNKFSIFIVVVLFVLGLVGLYVVTSDKFSFNLNKRASSKDIGSGLKFLWLNHSRRELTADEISYISKNYDVVVFGNQNKPMINEANNLKSVNPNIKVYLYFVTSLRQDISTNYGINEFKESWYLKDFNNNRIASTPTLEYVDLTNAEYRNWAISKIEEFLGSAPYDGVFLDNAMQIPLTNSWNQKIGKEKILSWNKARNSFISQINSLLDKKGKKTFYNGLNRSSLYHDKGTDALSFTDGVLNEYFCLNNAGDSSVLSRSALIEDIKLQINISKMNKAVFQKVNIDSSVKNRYGKFCYGVFLMGYVPGYGYFKYGEGYNLHRVPDEMNLIPSEINTSIGAPVSEFVVSGPLIYREFQKMWVIVNTSDLAFNWTNPRDGVVHSVPAKDTIFVENITITPQPSSPSSSPVTSSCRDYCINNQSRTGGGWCAFAERNCAISNADYISQGNQFCPSDRTYCCCRK